MEVFGSRRFAFLFSSKFVNLKMIFDIYLFIYFHTKAFSTNVPSSEAVRLQLDQFKITNSRKLKKWKWLLQGIPKNALLECCWSHSALAQSPFAGTPCVWRLIFWSFLTKTKQDQAPPSHVNGKI